MTYIIGIDPGPLVGVALLKLPATGEREWYGEIAQITPNGLWALLAGWIEAYEVRAVATERFVIGHRSSRVNDPGASQAARDVIGGLKLAIPPEVHRIARSAAEVKPWATDSRLRAAGLLVQTKGMTHARDATRHALFSACADFGARVPRAVAA